MTVLVFLGWSFILCIATLLTLVTVISAIVSNGFTGKFLSGGWVSLLFITFAAWFTAFSLAPFIVSLQ